MSYELHTVPSSKRKVYYCDVCSLSGKKHQAINSCNVCGKDLCREHTNFDPDDSGDYPEKWCPSCAQVREKYAPQMREAAQRYDELISNIELTWRTEAKGKGENK
mgnify:CR=1 FL=1